MAPIHEFARGDYRSFSAGLEEGGRAFGVSLRAGGRAKLQNPEDGKLFDPQI